MKKGPKCEMYTFLNREDRRIVEIEDVDTYEEELKYILDYIEKKKE